MSCLNGCDKPWPRGCSYFNCVCECHREKKMDNYRAENMGNGTGRTRNGSPAFYELLMKMANIHDKKSHDYASESNPSGNYHFAGEMSKLFNNPKDAGFIGRLGEKFYRLANLENNKKTESIKNESVEDTEVDICTITVLWMADRLSRRSNKNLNTEAREQSESPAPQYFGPESNNLPPKIKYQNKVEFNPESHDHAIKMSKFNAELTSLLNKYSIDNDLNTPDFILSRYIEENLTTLKDTKAITDKFKGNGLTE